MRRRQISYSAPFLFLNPYRFGSKAVAALEVGDGFLCVEYQIGISQVVVFAAKKDDFPGRYSYAGEAGLKDEIAELKRRALSNGATLEAIQLMGLLTPLKRHEETTMADNKLSRKTANKEELKAAAKEAPVAGKGKAAAAKAAPAAKVTKEEPAAPAKRKGNIEALQKAREARADKGPDNRKIVVLNKDHGAREGSNRANMLNIVLKAKTVQQALDGGAGRVDVNFAEKSGFIEIK